MEVIGKRESKENVPLEEKVQPLSKRLRPNEPSEDDIKEEIPKSFLEELQDMHSQVGTVAAAWSRTPIPSTFSATTDALIFQWVDIGLYDGAPLRTNPKKGDLVPGSSISPTPIIRLCGTTQSGHSVMLHSHGFVPYFYASCPSNFKEEDCAAVKEALEGAIGKKADMKECVQGIHMVHEKMSIYGYHFNRKSSFLKIYMTLPTLVAKARGIFEDGLHIAGYEFSRYSTYESNVPHVLRFMIDKDISGCNWLELPAGSYSIRNGQEKTSRCQFEVDIVYNNIISHSTDGEYGKLAPVRILSFDIECMGRKGVFPSALEDPVIQIANVVSEQGCDIPILRNVFVLGTCKNIVGANVFQFETEGELLEAWASFVRDVDPDIMTGYNIDNFDIPYLMDRGKALKLSRDYFSWGRLQNTYVFYFHYYNKSFIRV